MNHTFRVVWNDGLAACVAAPECARGRGKRAGLCAAAAMLSLLSCMAHALPTGGEVSAGQGSIGASGSAMTINQQSQNLSINWQSFGIGANEAVNFVQPNTSSIALNRVLGADSSQIFGRLSANGQVWLLNPNGVLFGSTAQVNVGGLIASTLNISDADFLAGKRTFTGSGGAVVNQGSITAADGGYVAMLGGRVSNEGVIQARLGTVALGAGSEITLDFAGDKLLSLQVDQGVVDALAQNKQLIQADGGAVLLSARAADALVGTVVNNSGVIEARTIDTSSGTIRLIGKDGGTVEAGGTLDASAPDGGNGGFIETSGARVKVADSAVVTTAAPFGTTGTWLIDPTDFNIASSGGDITGTALANQLNTTNVTILSSAGATPGIGDINVDDLVSWDSANSLTLSALHSVNVNQPITNACTGSVALRADNAGVCVAGAAGCGTVNFSGAGHVTVNGGAVNIYYNPAGSNNSADANGNGPSYATPGDYSSNVTLNGGSTLTAWMLVNDVNQLQAMSTNLGGDYALGRDVDASATANWNLGYGFAPVGYYPMPFSGIFDGRHFTISGLVIHRSFTDGPVGLFGAVRGNVLNTTLADVDIVGNLNVGALAGWLWGTVSSSSSSGRVAGSVAVGGLIGFGNGAILDSSSTSDVKGERNEVGGLVGHMDGGRIESSHATGQVMAEWTFGGLVGWNAATISNSYATGDLSWPVPDIANIMGGLVGENHAPITDSYATGNVRGWGTTGGLVGSNYPGATITRSYATGTVVGRGSGGLVGGNGADIIDSYATGTVSGEAGSGGLIAFNSGNILHSHASGTVNTSALGGGLVGSNSGTISESYATGNVNGGDDMGGLVGSNGGTISLSYATGDVISRGGNPYGVGHGDMVGGLVGLNAGIVTTSYATGNVSSLYGRDVGGLVGLNVAGESHPTSTGVQVQPGIISDSYATGSVSGVDSVGGLVGANLESLVGPVESGRASITNSYATGAVSGANYVGGLVGGSSNATIDGSFATGRVSAVSFAGGLVGGNWGTVTNSSASGDVEGITAGGLAGINEGNIGTSHASGNVLASGIGGGLVGISDGGVFSDYATGNVQGRGTLGGLVGRNGGVIHDSWASGDVSGSATAGGLVGYNNPNGGITDSYATGNVYGLYGAGGLVGLNWGWIENVYATGSVNSQEDGSYSGGLVGLNGGTIINGYATGNVISWSTAGGLVGINSGTISNVYATGDVRAYKGPAGGLAGSNSGSISIAYATGSVTGSRSSNGGLVGFNSGTLSEVFATGDVIGNSFSAASEYNGGLVGFNSGVIQNAYATGSVSVAPGSTADYNAGLVAYNTGTVAYTYSTGAVSGALNNGGLVAFNSGDVIDSYWDITTSGQKRSAAGTGLHDKQMKRRRSFVGFDFDTVWTIEQGRGYPTLQAF